MSLSGNKRPSSENDDTTWQHIVSTFQFAEPKFTDSNTWYCGVCYTHFPPNQRHSILIGPCGHILCNSCLAKNLEHKRKSCPFCKRTDFLKFQIPPPSHNILMDFISHPDNYDLPPNFFHPAKHTTLECNFCSLDISVRDQFTHTCHLKYRICACKEQLLFETCVEHAKTCPTLLSQILKGYAKTQHIHRPEPMYSRNLEEIYIDDSDDDDEIEIVD